MTKLAKLTAIFTALLVSSNFFAVRAALAGPFDPAPQIQTLRVELNQREAALAKLKTSLAHAEKTSDVAFRISVPLMVVGILGSAGLFFSGAFGDSADSYINSLAEKATTGYGERIAFDGASILVLSVAGGEVAIYITQAQRNQIGQDIAVAEGRLKQDRIELDSLTPPLE